MKTTTEWWLNRDTIDLYHGTHIKNLDSIRNDGIQSPAWLTPSLETAKNYCCFAVQGVSEVWRTHRLQIPHPRDMIVIHAAVPRDYVLQNSVYDHPPKHINKDWDRHKRRQARKEVFDTFTGTPEQYYLWTECRFDAGLPPEFIREHSYPYV